MKTPIERSPRLMSANDTGLLVVDVQEKLIRTIPDRNRICWNIGRLIRGARILRVDIGVTEQYPRGLGSTISSLTDLTGELEIPSKLTFSCRGCPDIFDRWSARGVTRVLATGIETHVCVQQTVLDLIDAGAVVYVAVDATGSRNELDESVALRRMEAAGAVLTTTEAALFEWTDTAGTPEFKEISRLIREEAP